VSGDKYLAAGGERRHPRRNIDRRSEVVAAALDSRAVVAAHANRRRLVAAHRIARDPQTKANGSGGIGHSEHERVADRLHVLAVDAWKLSLNGIRKLLHELHRLLVSMRLRERGKARDVREQEGRLGVPRHG
jgi:hypothetical protein